MTNIADLELSRALAAAGCGILRRPKVERPAHGDRDWLIVATKGSDQGISLSSIVHAVSEVTAIGRAELKSPRRRRDVVRARMIYYAVARQITSHSLPTIGRAIGGKDHSTIMHGLARVEEDRPYFEPHLSRVLAALGRGGPAVHNYTGAA